MTFLLIFILFYTLLNFKNLKTFFLFKMGLCKFKNCSIQNLLHFLGGRDSPWREHGTGYPVIDCLAASVEIPRGYPNPLTT